MFQRCRWKQQHRRSWLVLFTDRCISRFLLVSLDIDAILQGTTISGRRKKLNEMTDRSGLEGAYGATLSRIKAQGGEKSRLGIVTLIWISHSERPLRVDELRHALGVEIGSANLDGDNVPSIGTVLACCQGLVFVDKEASTVRLIHFTLQEYLQAHAEHFDRPHAAMEKTCLSYLNSYQVKALSPDSWPHDPHLQSTPFLEYCSVYWGAHAKRDLSECAKQLALELFGGCSNHISAKLLLETERSCLYFPSFRGNFESSGLHCVSLYGIAEIVTSLVEVEGCDINQTDCTGNIPLIWAAVEGHEEVVKILLGRDGVDPNKQGSHRRTPLWNAAFYGHEGVLKMLLERDYVDPNIPDCNGRTPLWGATETRRGEMIKMLLGRGDVNPNILDKDGRTPLWWAAKNGHKGIVEILLGRGDIKPDIPDCNGRTPLCDAAGGGHRKVVKMLLGRDDVNPDIADKYGQTPLLCAAWYGHEGVVKTLLGRGDVNPDKPDRYGKTPLFYATSHGHAGVVALLQPRAPAGSSTA